MSDLTRVAENPILQPDKEVHWESYAAFNPSVVKNNNHFHLLYRAMGASEDHQGVHMAVSTIGYAESRDGIHFKGRRQLIKPEEVWERFGCEDPRVTFLNGKYYIFYTALSSYPFGAPGIRVGVAITKDFQKIEEKTSCHSF